MDDCELCDAKGGRIGERPYISSCRHCEFLICPKCADDFDLDWEGRPYWVCRDKQACATRVAEINAAHAAFREKRACI